ncbi:MAG: DUF2778 domain-containing protein [Alphaproteobacteria bacterium]|nr:MAG: DUF2778 domain-containing protein [Alphaproteobacteria bacterium]
MANSWNNRWPWRPLPDGQNPNRQSSYGQNPFGLPIAPQPSAPTAATGSARRRVPMRVEEIPVDIRDLPNLTHKDFALMPKDVVSALIGSSPENLGPDMVTYQRNEAIKTYGYKPGTDGPAPYTFDHGGLGHEQALVTNAFGNLGPVVMAGDDPRQDRRGRADWADVENDSYDSISEKSGDEQEPDDEVGSDYVADMTFDGESLSIVGGPTFHAVSGRSGYTSPEHQGLKDTGPIPEGFYLAAIEQFQVRDDSLGEYAKWVVGRGRWRGGAHAWGNSRVWLEPLPGTDTYGRDNFSIHGGAVPGSAGCIDLTSDMDAFAEYFLERDEDLVLEVDYE